MRVVFLLVVCLRSAVLRRPRRLLLRTCTPHRPLPFRLLMQLLTSMRWTLRLCLPWTPMSLSPLMSPLHPRRRSRRLFEVPFSLSRVAATVTIVLMLWPLPILLLRFRLLLRRCSLLGMPVLICSRLRQRSFLVLASVLSSCNGITWWRLVWTCAVLVVALPMLTQLKLSLLLLTTVTVATAYSLLRVLLSSPLCVVRPPLRLVAAHVHAPLAPRELRHVPSRRWLRLTISLTLRMLLA